jgi:phosphofructokinase-like protein
MSRCAVKRVGILTAGGDCPGLNAVIRAVAKSLILQYGIEVMGIEDGFEGLVEKRIRELRYNDVSGILQIGGTILGTTNKADPFNFPIIQDGVKVQKDFSDQAIQNASEIGLDAIICIGGDGSMTIASKLIAKGMKIVGVPKTIDNDLYGTDFTFGYDTAVSIAAEAIDRIHTTAMSHHRVMIVETMGRYAGWLALGAGIASGADIILVPEIEYEIEEIIKKVMERSRLNRKFSIIAVAEGAKPKGGALVVSRVVKDSPEKLRLGGIAIKLSNDIEDLTGLETRATVLGHLQRGGTPTAFDRILATRYGVAAAELLAAGRFNRMVALNGSDIVSVPIEDVGGKTRTVPLDSSLIKVAKAVGTSLGTAMVP